VGAVLTIAAKDLRQRIRDRSALIVAVVAPFMLAAVFSLLIPAGDEGFHPDYGVVDADGGPIAEAFVDGAMAGLVEADAAEVREVASESEARRLVEDGEVEAAFLIPAGFSEAVSAGEAARITIVGNADSAFATQVAEALATAFLEDVASVRLSVATVVQQEGAADEERIAELGELARAAPDPIRLAGTLTESRQVGSTTFYAASMAIFFLFFTAQFGPLSLLGERRGGTLPRLVAAPIAPWSIVLGKALGSFVLAAVAMAVLVVASSLLLGARWGDPLAVALLVLGAVVAAMGITALVTTLSRTEEQAGSWNSIAAVTLAILGGAFFPLARGPELLQQVSLVTPHAWFLRGIGDLAPSGTGVATVALPIAVLFGIGVLTGAVGLLRARGLVVAR
jgi:ABC-2 type transport system permease protein